MKSRQGSVNSKKSASVLKNFDADAIQEEPVEESPAHPTDQSRKIKLNATVDSSPLLATSTEAKDLENGSGIDGQPSSAKKNNDYFEVPETPDAKVADNDDLGQPEVVDVQSVV